jgi:carbonic anhydrase/acetyltransferase-like protein (isoleucine patch superfamily)
MLLEHEGRRPKVHPSAYVAPTAVVSGDVTVGADCRVLFGAVLTDDGGPVELGGRCIVMENALVRGRAGHPAVIGDDVIVGPHAHLNGARAGDGAFVATGVSAFPGSRIGAGAEVRINAVVHVNSSLPDGVTVPIGWIALGDPAELFSPDRHDELAPVQQVLDFPGTVFGLPRGAGQDLATRGYAQLFGSHRDDVLLSP